MTQGMSRVDRCIDNNPLEGFWGTVKCEMYYLNYFGAEDRLKENQDLISEILAKHFLFFYLTGSGSHLPESRLFIYFVFVFCRHRRISVVAVLRL